ncbi:hypothetical protein SDC9_142760 [bioreactor metagenome]|uniref:Uncharacterized protein n=1 Tax=bioreactor metagenome TaxID=1076179 RepID=A0A645E252_9ZZZZ
MQIAAAHSCKSSIGNIVHIKIELTVEHACCKVACNQFGTSVSFAYLVQVFVFEVLLHFIGEFAPEFFGNVLTGIVAETVQVEFAQPEQCRVGHHVHNFWIC